MYILILNIEFRFTLCEFRKYFHIKKVFEKLLSNEM